MQFENWDDTIVVRKDTQGLDTHRIGAVLQALEKAFDTRFRCNYSAGRANAKTGDIPKTLTVQVSLEDPTTDQWLTAKERIKDAFEVAAKQPSLPIREVGGMGTSRVVEDADSSGNGVEDDVDFVDVDDEDENDEDSAEWGTSVVVIPKSESFQEAASRAALEELPDIATVDANQPSVIRAARRTAAHV